ncbi:arylsulfatase [Reichenbachiella agarivorans]|uniref:Arylsulfatase n=1 Tax=Reichenbachiella agarivorans TaxID=2979464 RepID=A0ABY6CN99_9BACT|nr:arylsulfatase [Reichenbachiella agarivorans]UXP31997.1 arylsulfatase [Reichenbachiella agarivorans]
MRGLSKLVIGLCMWIGMWSCVEVETRLPNVVLVISDDQGYGDVGVHGNPIIQTPNMDELHGQSTRLTDFHVSPTCAPTRAALLTGRYSNRTGVWHTIAGRSLLHDSEVTLAEVLRQNGYATGMFGKWHLGDNFPFRPEDNGFEEVVAHMGGGVGQQPDYWNNDYFDDVYYHNGKPKRYEGYCTDIWFEQAIDFIDAKHKANEPFFTYISTNAPHGPYYVADEYMERYKNNPDVVNPAFYGMIDNLDDNLGRLMNYLDENELSDNTIFIFMTDNGTAAGFNYGKGGLAAQGYNAGMRGGKGTEYEGGHRVPFFIRWPQGGIKAGKDIDDLTSHIDIMPTLLALVGAKSTPELSWDGVSLKDLLLGRQKTASSGRVIVTDSQRKEFPEKWRNSATMQDKWRLINGKSLYKVDDDPGQQTDVKNDYPEKFKELTMAYDAWWNGIQDDIRKTPRFPLCTDQEPVTLLHAHDLHLYEERGITSVPWNSMLMREGFKTDGFYTVTVPEAGKYRFELFRWPPEAQAALAGEVAPRPAVPGTTVEMLPAGIALPIKKAYIDIAGQQTEKDVDPQAESVSFELTLEPGDTELKAQFAEEEAEPYAAFYVRVSKV